jgi:hypothetical protein
MSYRGLSRGKPTERARSMSIPPVIWYLIPCKKEPTLVGMDPSVHEILYAVQPKPPAVSYPVWLRTFYVFAMITDGQGECEFQLELRLASLDAQQGNEVESVVGKSRAETTDLGNNPLRFQFMSLMMPPVKLPQNGVYRLYLICNGIEIGSCTLLAR